MTTTARRSAVYMPPVPWQYTFAPFRASMKATLLLVVVVVSLRAFYALIPDRLVGEELARLAVTVVVALAIQRAAVVRAIRARHKSIEDRRHLVTAMLGGVVELWDSLPEGDLFKEVRSSSDRDRAATAFARLMVEYKMLARDVPPLKPNSPDEVVTILEALDVFCRSGRHASVPRAANWLRRWIQEGRVTPDNIEGWLFGCALVSVHDVPRDAPSPDPTTTTTGREERVG